MTYNGITFIMTACNRPDLTARTLESFFRLTEHQGNEPFIVHIDGMDAEVVRVVQVYPWIKIIGSTERVGLAVSLDKLMAEVQTEYVFSMEDDWYFAGNPFFLAQCVTLLTHMRCDQVWVRDLRDHEHPTTTNFPKVCDYVPYYEIAKKYQGHWGGFSFNPSMRRTADYKRLFPNGYAEFGDEADCSRHVERIGYRALSLSNGACTHIGWNRHTEGFRV